MEQNGIENGEEFVETTDYEGNLFQYICREGDVRELLESVQTMRCMDVLYQYDVYGRQATHAVAECDQVNAKSKIEILSLMGADINTRERKMGNTLLHIAANTRNYLLAEWICRRPGANLGAINFEHDTAYHLAYKAADFRMMELLRDNGAVCDDPRDVSESLDLALR